MTHGQWNWCIFCYLSNPVIICPKSEEVQSRPGIIQSGKILNDKRTRYMWTMEKGMNSIVVDDGIDRATWMSYPCRSSLLVRMLLNLPFDEGI